MMKLSQLVSSALEDAQAKVASAKDAEKTAGVATQIGKKIQDNVATRSDTAQRAAGALHNLGARLGSPSSTESALGRGVLAAGGAGAAALGTAALGAKKLMGKKEPEKVGALDTAVEAMKLAESLEHLAMLFPKLAEESTQINDINGPAVLVSPNMGTTKDSPTKATSIPAHRAHSGGGSGPNMAIETNKHPDAGDQSYAAKAAHAILEAKVAQSNALLMAGHAQAATQLAKQAQVEFLQAKRAYEEEDASTNTPKGNPQSLAVNRNPGDLPVPSGPVTDNAGMIAMTKRQAKTEDVRREAGKHVQETALSAASDKGLTDNLDHTEGAKIANIFQMAAMRKRASFADSFPGPDMTALNPEAYQAYKDRMAHGSAALLGGLGALSGGAGGALLGHAIHGAPGAAVGGAVGVPVGALLGGAVGYGGSRLGSAAREAVDRRRESTQGQSVINGKMVVPQNLDSLTRRMLGNDLVASPEEVAAAMPKAAGAAHGFPFTR